MYGLAVNTISTTTTNLMSYQIVTEVHFVPTGDPKHDKPVSTYPDKLKAYLDKKSKVINLPKGLMFNHAEELANTLMNEHGVFSSYVIVKIADKK